MGGIDIGGVLSGLGSGLSSLAGGGGGGGGGGSSSNTSTGVAPNTAAQNILTNPDILAQFAMDQGEGPPQQAPPIPPTPTFASTNFFSPQQTTPYSGAQPQQPAQNPWRSAPQPASTPDLQYDPSTGWPLPPSTPPPATPASAATDPNLAKRADIADQPVQITNPVPEFGYESTQYPQPPQGPSPFEAGGGTSAVGTSPVGGGTGDGATPPAAGKGTSVSDIAKKGADIANKAKGLAGPQQRGYYPDIAGSAREAGMGAPSAYTPQGGGPGFNPLQSIADALFGHPMGSGLAGAARQAGPNYGATGLPSPQPTAGAGPAAAGAPTAQAGAMPPGSAAEAVQAGARGAGLGRPTAAGGEKPPLVLRDPSDPSKGYMVDPNYTAQHESAQPTGNRAGDEGAGSPIANREPQSPPAAEGTGQNWWGSRPPDYFQHHGGRVGGDLTTVNTPYGRVTANQQVAQDFQGLTNEMKSRGVPGIQKFGSYNPRPKRYGQGYSSHAYGAAFDINDAAGPMNPQTQGWINDHPREWQDMLRRHNFAQYMPRGDPNHLEWTGPGSGKTPSYASGTSIDRRSNMALTRGDRNNNPGNIKMGPDAMQYGATGHDNQGHAIFSNWQDGARAQASLLRNHYNGLTVPQMFNHGRGYAQDPGWPRGVMQFGGFGPHEKLDLNDPKTLDRLQRAIWRQEGTHPPADQAQTQLPTQLAGNLDWGDIIGMMPLPGGQAVSVARNVTKSTPISRDFDPNRRPDMSTLGLPGIAQWRRRFGDPDFGRIEDGKYVP